MIWLERRPRTGSPQYWPRLKPDFLYSHIFFPSYIASYLSFRWKSNTRPHKASDVDHGWIRALRDVSNDRQGPNSDAGPRLQTRSFLCFPHAGTDARRLLPIAGPGLGGFASIDNVGPKEPGVLVETRYWTGECCRTSRRVHGFIMQDVLVVFRVCLLVVGMGAGAGAYGILLTIGINIRPISRSVDTGYILWDWKKELRHHLCRRTLSLWEKRLQVLWWEGFVACWPREGTEGG